MKLTIPLLFMTGGLGLSCLLLQMLVPSAKTVEEAGEILRTSFFLLLFGVPTLVVGWTLRPHLEAQLAEENREPVVHHTEDKLTQTFAVRSRSSLQRQR